MFLSAWFPCLWGWGSFFTCFFLSGAAGQTCSAHHHRRSLHHYCFCGAIANRNQWQQDSWQLHTAAAAAVIKERVSSYPVFSSTISCMVDHLRGSLFPAALLPYHAIAQRQGAEVKGTIECEAARVNGKFDGVFVSSHSLHVSCCYPIVSFVRFCLSASFLFWLLGFWVHVVVLVSCYFWFFPFPFCFS